MKRGIIMASLLTAATGAYAQSTYTVTIDPAVTYQTIEDFGASDCWTADFVGRYFTEAEREKAAQWLFSQEFDSNGNPEGIGLSLWRVNLGAGTAEQGDNSGISDISRRGYCYLTSSGTYDWTKSAGQQYFMQRAKAYGVDHFLLFSNSAPVQFTKNGKGYADSGVDGSNLKDDRYADFAKFLATTARHFEDEGYNVTTISPVNEPQYDWSDGGQEGSPWTNDCIAKLARQLDESLTDAGSDAKILLPEACQWKALYTDGTEKRANNQIESFFNKSSANYIGDIVNLKQAVAGHSYWTFGSNDDLENVREAAAAKAAEYGLAVLQTEWSMLDAEPSTEAGFPASYDAASYTDIAVYMAKIIHCDLVFGGMASWSYWTTFAQEKWSQKNRFYLIRMNYPSDTSNESYEEDLTKAGTLTDNQNLWALGNYSRFIRPGYRRIGHTTNQTESLNKLLGSAYISPDGKRVVAVYVNMASSATGVKLNVSGETSAKISVYRTSETESLKAIGGEFKLGTRIAIPKKSVTTIVIDLGDASSAIDDIKAVDLAGDGNVYTPSGVLVRRDTESLDGLPRGLYIYNGKKILVR